MEEPSSPRRNRRSETVRRATRETWLGPEHFILPLFVNDEAKNQVRPITFSRVSWS